MHPEEFRYVGDDESDESDDARIGNTECKKDRSHAERDTESPRLADPQGQGRLPSELQNIYPGANPYKDRNTDRHDYGEHFGLSHS